VGRNNPRFLQQKGRVTKIHKTFSEIIAAEFREVRAASTASGGTALTSTAGLIAIPNNSDWIGITPRNFAGAAVARFLLNPWLTIIATRDALGIMGESSILNTFDISAEVQDGDTTDVQMDAISTAANNDFIYVGSVIPFRGVRITAGSDPNNTASALTVNYWGGTSWKDITVTDGSDAAGVSFTQTGNATWTVPTDWAAASLLNIGDTLLKNSWSMVKQYWTRWQFAATTEDTWNVIGMQALNRVTTYAELLSGQTYEQAIQSGGPGGFGCVEALTDAGTANLIVNVATGRGENF